MSGNRVPGGVVHKLPADLRQALIANSTALAAWSMTQSRSRRESGASAGRRRSSRKVSADRAAGRDASIASAPADKTRLF